MWPEVQGEIGHMNCLTYGRPLENKVLHQLQYKQVKEIS